MSPIAIVVTALVVVAIGVAIMYNRLVRARLHVREAWSAIEVQLQRRASLIPNLVETVKGYAAYERGTLKDVVAARTAVGAASSPRAAATANASLTTALQSFFAVAEAYPDLQANTRFAQLQKDLTDTENTIAYARNYYNGAVEIYNIAVQSFPSLLVAPLFGFSRAEFFTADDAARPVVPVAV